MQSAVNTVQDIQSEIERALECLPKLQLLSRLPEELKPLMWLAAPRQGLRAHVSLRHAPKTDKKKNRQVRHSAPVSSWLPDSDLIEISYNVSELEKKISVAAGKIKAEEIKSVENAYDPEQKQIVKDPARELLQALAQAEMGRQFVSLKWFRDTCLPQKGFAWGAAHEDRNRVLTGAINRRWILTSTISNPKNPQFPVTAIRVNRPMDEVRAILDENAKANSVFAPISIPGERLSETVLRERR